MMQNPNMMQESEMDDAPLNEDDPTFQAILQFSMSALYENGAAKDLANGLKSAPDPATGLADAAYKIIEIAGSRVEGEMDEELLPLLAIVILQEIVEIGESAGIQYKGSDMALALRKMILQFLEESGLDASQLSAAMDQVDTSVFDQEVA